ncbi:MAG TPA: TraR/DksA family transcriptional regulator [Bryobacteraceae bacterium]|nr:TraR/DksA family transcriptional regulator [Bryobacteraceae bacterium]
MMKKTDGNHKAYRQMLLNKRQEVLSGLDMKFDTLAKMGRVAEEDQAQITHDEFVSLHINSLDYGRLRMIEEALDRLKSGDYGFCLSCEEPIPPKRLNAIPWARYCVTCQELASSEVDEEHLQLAESRE